MYQIIGLSISFEPFRKLSFDNVQTPQINMISAAVKLLSGIHSNCEQISITYSPTIVHQKTIFYQHNHHKKIFNPMKHIHLLVLKCRSNVLTIIDCVIYLFEVKNFFVQSFFQSIIK